MSEPIKIVEREEDTEAELAEFFKDMPPTTTRQNQQLLAYFHDEFGGRIVFDPKTQRIILEIKRGEDSIEVSCSLNEFVRKITRVAVKEMWLDAGLLV